VISAVRDLNRTALAGEAVRAALEALTCAAPHWVAQVIDVPGWSRRYGARVDTWRMPSSKTKREQLAVDFGRDGFAVLGAVYDPAAPAGGRQIPAVQVLRTVLVQNYIRFTARNGKEVIKRREAEDEGLPPGHLRLTSPYDLDARWGVKGDFLWNGYKLHVSEGCTDAAEDDRGHPNLITNVATTDATVPDVTALDGIQACLQRCSLLPGEHYVDSGYASAELSTGSLPRDGIALITPVLADTSRQARAKGFDASKFAIDWANQQVRCPQGQTSSSWSPAHRHGKPAVVVKWATTICCPCPVRQACTTSKRGYRQLSLHPRALAETLHAARTAQADRDWKTAYALRAGVEGSIAQAVCVTGCRRARYRGLAKTHLEHVFSAVALNLIRLDAWWHGRPLDRTRTSHLARLELALAA
jgi:hypothetical protein